MDAHRLGHPGRRSDTLTMPAGEQRADTLIAAVPARAWQKISAGAGAHGPREYHWARVPVRPGWERGRGHWLLARRSLSSPDEILVLVPLAPKTPAPSPHLPLSATRLRAHQVSG